MYFLYIDGSGNPSLKDTTDQYYVLGGVAIAEEGVKLIETELSISKYFPNILNRPEELKLTSIHHGKWWKTQPNGIKDKIINDVVGLIAKTNAVLFEIIIDKNEHRKRYLHSEDPCLLALRFLITRYSKFLRRESSYGIIIYDKDREKDIFQSVRIWKDQGLVLTTALNPFLHNEVPEKIVEYIMFVDSRYSPCMWIADFWARSAFLNKKRGGYYLYQQMSKNLDKYGRYEHPKPN